jgi:hypothetical protein
VLGGGAATAASHSATGYSYIVEGAHLNVFEDGKYRSSHPPVRWDGDGHHHETMTPPDPELPPLPAPLATKGVSGVSVPTDVVIDGQETLIDADGNREPCSGVFSSEDKAGISVEVNAKGGRARTTWKIPNDFVSPKCGFGYDYLPNPLVDHNPVKGDIGDRHLVLIAKGKRSKTKILADGSTVEHNLSWEGAIVLRRGKAF